MGLLGLGINHPPFETAKGEESPRMFPLIQSK